LADGKPDAAGVIGVGFGVPGRGVGSADGVASVVAASGAAGGWGAGVSAGFVQPTASANPPIATVRHARLPVRIAHLQGAETSIN
jgi:hypothetical protein